MEVWDLIKNIGIPAFFAVVFWFQIKSTQDSLQKRLDSKSEQDMQRETRMAERIDALETEIRGKLEDMVTEQQAVLRDATSAIRDNTSVILGLKALLPKQP